VVGWHRRNHPWMRRIFAETTELRCIIEPGPASLTDACSCFALGLI
jgi:hypothetical protein